MNELRIRYIIDQLFLLQKSLVDDLQKFIEDTIIPNILYSIAKDDETYYLDYKNNKQNIDKCIILITSMVNISQYHNLTETQKIVFISLLNTTIAIIEKSIIQLESRELNPMKYFIVPAMKNTLVKYKYYLSETI